MMENAVGGLTDDIGRLQLGAKKWSSTDLDTQINILRKPAIKSGNPYIYELWISLLDRWLSRPGSKVYLASPFLDPTRLTDICKIVIDKSETANIEAFYVRNDCYKDYNNQKQFSDAKKLAISRIEKEFTKALSSTLEEKIFKKVVHPDVKNTRYFHAKFIACTYENSAEVLVTSANFAGNHFECNNHDSVVYCTMTEGEFLEKYIDLYPPQSTSVS